MQGDLFIYLDTAVGGSEVVYNPYSETAVSTAIFLPNRVQADYLIWVEDANSVMMLAWNGATWQPITAADAYTFGFDADRITPQTDLYIPFDTVGITNPATQSLAMVALASEEDGLKVWATMPANNNLNSERVIGAPATSDVEIFTLLNAYSWSSLDAGLCPHDLQPHGNTLDSNLTANTVGASYKLFADNLVAIHPKLLPDNADWTTGIDLLCNGIPVLDNNDVPLPALCQRDVAGASSAVNPARDLPFSVNTEQSSVADGDNLNLTLQLTNNGAEAMQDLTVLLVAEALATLPNGSLNGDRYEETITVGALAVGATEIVEMQAVVDAAFNPDLTEGWTQLQAILYDATGSTDAPLEILYLNHQLDEAGPSYMEIEGPITYIGDGEQKFSGFVVDKSAVPMVVLEINGTEYSCENNDASEKWECVVDLGERNDGDLLTVRAKAIDVHGQESDWFDTPTLIVDKTAPTLAATNVTTRTFDGGLVGPSDNVIIGQLSDERLVQYVEVCEEDTCTIVNNVSEADIVEQSLYSYEDQPETPILITQDSSCSTPTVRTFDIVDSFIIDDLDVGLRIEHAFRNDINVWLTSPANTRVQLVGQTAGVPDLNVLLNDAEVFGVSMADDLLPHQFVGTDYAERRSPFEHLLYTFHGEDAQGIWQLEICDAYPAEDVGWYQQSALYFQADVAPVDTQTNWVYNLDLPQNVEGVERSLTIYGYDSVDNASAPIDLTFEVDTLAPRLAVETAQLASQAINPIMLSGQVEDANVVSMRIAIRTPGGELVGDWVEVVGQEWVYANAAHFAQPGTYQLWLEAEDSAGNVAYSTVYEVTREIVVETIYLPILLKDGVPGLANHIYLPFVHRTD